MTVKKYVLWIEDDAAYNLQRLAIPVVMHRDYDLTLAVTISEAIHFLQRQTYEVIVVDLRMPPGKEHSWIDLDQKLARSGQPPRLGLHLLLNLFKQPQRGYEIDLPSNILYHNIHRFGILSVDPARAVCDELERINFEPEGSCYKQKTAGMPSNTLLELIQNIHRE
ncbi:MAG: hypothetical protein H6650_01980 [Ardenticatenales bacterium]|nr:hypothetical protein [Ardenticatenales bacterium]